MPKGNRGSRGKFKAKRPERFQIQVGFSFDQDLKPDQKEDLKIRALESFFESHGEAAQIPGCRMVIRWRNPDNKNQRHANWKTSDDGDQDLGEVYRTLHGGNNGRGALRGILNTMRQKKAELYGYW